MLAGCSDHRPRVPRPPRPPADAVRVVQAVRQNIVIQLAAGSAKARKQIVVLQMHVLAHIIDQLAQSGVQRAP